MTTGNLRNRIDQAAENAEKRKQALLRPDGSKIYAEEEHAERLAQINGAFASVAEEVVGELDETIEEAQAEVEQHRHPDPTNSLTPSQLQAANSKAMFVREDCEDLPLPDLAKRLRGVLAGGERASMWLHARYARRRVDALDRALREGNARERDAVGLHGVVTTLENLEDRVVSATDRKYAALAEEEIASAKDVKRHVVSLRTQLDGTQAQTRDWQRQRVSAI